jgi:hypothetical protein
MHAQLKAHSETNSSGSELSGRYPWAEVADIQIDEISGPASEVQVYSAVIYNVDLEE